tara:strand:- start:2661 stop:3248 length:588 start_codon:yes stop_codon:yes gene_type:complete
MEQKQPTNKINPINEITKAESAPSDKPQDFVKNNESNLTLKTKPESSEKSSSDKIEKSKQTTEIKSVAPKKPVKPPKIEDKPFNEFVSKHLIPGLKSSIETKGTLVNEIKLLQGTRPVVGGKCWMIFCEITDQRRFWLCFNKELITSDKTILLAESNSEPSIVESFLIDEKKTTLALLISRVLQRLNGQKWFGAN